MTQSTSKKLTRAEQKVRRPLQILEAAFEEFVDKGYVATRVEDIADRVGVTKGTIYVYFETKEQLFSAMVRHISVPFEDALAKADGLAGSCTEQLSSLIRLFYENIVDDRKSRELLRFVVAEGSRFPHVVDQHHAEFIDPLIARTQSIIDKGVEQGEFRPGPGALADVVISPVMLTMVFKLIFDTRRSFDRAAFFQAHLDLVLNGLKL